MTTKTKRKRSTKGPGNIERRIYTVEWREAVPGSDGRQRWATAVTYGSVDTYGTLWTPGVFDKALSERMPTLLYGHDWYSLEHVLGKGIDHREEDYGVDVLIEFDDPEFVPMARQAMWQVEHRTLRDVSVGFERFEWRRGDALTDAEKALGADEAMDQAGMDELSLVVRGAVPGASMRMRGARGAIDVDAVMEIARRKAAGELTAAEAQAAIELLSDDTLGDLSDLPIEDLTDDGGDGDEGEAAAEAAAQVEADADAALASLGL